MRWEERGAFSPVGNNILTFVFVTDGDMELAINVVSLSIILLSLIHISEPTRPY